MMDQHRLPFERTEDLERGTSSEPGTDVGPGTGQAPGPKYPGPIFVRHPRARRYVVSVREDGRVRVTLPRWGSMREAREFFGRLDGDGWIEKQRRRIEADRRAVPRVPDTDRRGAMESRAGSMCVRTKSASGISAGAGDRARRAATSA
jgi:hypothetical protein